MSGRKEERERLREERLAAQRAASSSEKRRLYLGYAAAGLIVVAIVAGLIIAVTSSGGDEPGTDSEGNEFPALASIQDTSGAVPPGIQTDGREGTPPPEPQTAILEDAAEAASCDLELDLPNEGNTHIDDEDASDVEYETSPPTSGDHYAGNETGSGALAGGAYLEYPPVGRSVHALEHGRIAIQYSPDLPEADQLALKGVFDEDPDSMILFPNPDMPYEVAVTAWNQLAGCDTYEGAATLDLLRAFRDTYRGLGPEPFPVTG